MVCLARQMAINTGLLRCYVVVLEFFESLPAEPSVVLITNVYSAASVTVCASVMHDVRLTRVRVARLQEILKPENHIKRSPRGADVGRLPLALSLLHTDTVSV